MMKKMPVTLAILLVALTVIGCDHSTNNEPPPAGSGITIINPTPESFVDGTVNIALSLQGVAPEVIEFYIDGRIVETRTEAPWQYAWNTATLPSNSSHTIKARAYNNANSYTSSQDVTVRIK